MDLAPLLAAPGYEEGKPFLRLCKECNHRSAALGIKAEIEGCEVCLPCAAAIDQWTEDIETWRTAKKRKRRNRAKAARRARTKRRRGRSGS